LSERKSVFHKNTLSSKLYYVSRILSPHPSEQPYHHDNHYHRKDTRAAHAASAYGGESAGAGFHFQGGAAAFVPL